MTGDPRVVFITGWGRSGSTVLNRVLARPLVVGAGEVRYLWRRGVLEGRDCSCGQHWQTCEAWGPAVRELASARNLEPEALARRADRDGARAERRAAAGLALRPAEADYVTLLADTYRAFAGHSGASVVVDSSKDPAQALLARRTGLDVTIVHLVRDPRAVAWSHRRTKAPPAGVTDEPTPTRPSGYVAARWLGRNAFIEARLPVDVLLRYEDLVTDPEAAAATILGDSAEQPPRSGPDQGPNSHVIAGNPGRFDRQPLVLRVDDEWRHAQPRGQRALATVIAGPLLHRYGYRARR